MIQLYKYVTNNYDVKSKLKFDYLSTLKAIDTNWFPSYVHMNLENSAL